MTDDLVKEAQLQLWSAYCDKKMELEAANDRIEKLEAALLEIDKIAISHIKGGIGKAQLIARKALEGKDE